MVSPALAQAGLSPGELASRLTQAAAGVRGGGEPLGELASTHPWEVARFAAGLFANAQAGAADAGAGIERDVRAMMIEVSGLTADAQCVLTGSGTESLLLALLAARTARGVGQAEVVAAANLHPSIVRTAQILGLRLVVVRLDNHGRADPAAFAEALTPRTIALIASAPAWASGEPDPVEAIAAIAAEHGLACHVDACIGGFLYPFCDGEPPILAPPGVTSISVDLHKFGYAPRSLSAVCFASTAGAAGARFSHHDWEGFPYASDRLGGDRPLWPTAGAWAVAQGLGRDGYRAYARRLETRKRRLLTGLADGPIFAASGVHAPVIRLRSAHESLAELSCRLQAAEVAHVACERPGFLRLRLDPLIDEAAFDGLEARLIELGRGGGS